MKIERNDDMNLKKHGTTSRHRRVSANPATRNYYDTAAAKHGAHAIHLDDQGANGHYTGAGTAAIGA